MSHDHADSALPGVAPVWTVVVAGGSGLRFGARKQFADLGGQSVLQRSVDGAARVSSGVVVVVPSDAVSDQALVSAETDVVVVEGGATRAESVRAGLAAIPADVVYVLVHDAARPLASSALFESVVAALVGGANAVVPAISVPDTIRHVGGGIVDRRELLAVQTPQGFPLSVLRAAHASGAEATDDATLVEALGHEVVIVEGEVRNRKITEPTDLVAASAIMGDVGFRGSRPGVWSEAQSTTTGHDVTQLPTIRVGQGFDIHPFSDDPDRQMVLGGVRFTDDRPGLAGHSDADVIAHAVADALLGAAGLGDIGSHFPDTDPAFLGADSIELLRSAAASVRAAGWEPQNADCSVVLDQPKLAPHRAQMEQLLSEAVGAPVTVKGKRPEGIGALGRHEGIACWAVALVARP